jgi:hypothetical protein
MRRIDTVVVDDIVSHPNNVLALTELIAADPTLGHLVNVPSGHSLELRRATGDVGRHHPNADVVSGLDMVHVDP